MLLWQWLWQVNTCCLEIARQLLSWRNLWQSYRVCFRLCCKSWESRTFWSRGTKVFWQNNSLINVHALAERAKQRAKFCCWNVSTDNVSMEKYKTTPQVKWLFFHLRCKLRLIIWQVILEPNSLELHSLFTRVCTLRTLKRTIEFSRSVAAVLLWRSSIWI